MTKRRHKRRPVRLPIRYSLTVKEEGGVRNLQLTGTVIDLSREGFGLLTDYPLVQGSVLKIRSRESEVPRHGVVRWVNREGGLYRAGLRTCRQDGRV